MTAIEIQTALGLVANHCLYHHEGDWYQQLRRFPGILFDPDGYVIFEDQQSYLNEPRLKHGVKLHVQDSIKSLGNYRWFTEEQLYILSQVMVYPSKAVNNLEGDVVEVNQPAERRPKNIDSIIRSQAKVNLIKRIRQHTCQICQDRLQIGPNSFYSEVHHVRPLGEPHNGPDSLPNMLCVCPNCHKKLDYGFVEIDYSTLTILVSHMVGEEFVNYHNQKVRSYLTKGIQV